MNRLKRLLPLILIGLALLLSGASKSPKPSPSGTTQSQQHTDAEKAKAKNVSIPNITTSQGPAESHQAHNEKKPIEILVLKDWSDYGLLYIAALVGLITYYQYRIAKLAYLVDRPYVIVGETAMLNLTTAERMVRTLPLTTARIRVENVGKRPAIIDKVNAELFLLPDASGNGIPFPPADWGNLKGLRRAASEKKVIQEKGSIEMLAQYQSGLLSEEDYKAVKMTYKKIVVLVGIIKYRPVAGRWYRYKTTFGLVYNPPGFLGEKDFFRVGPDKYNRNT